MKKQAVTKSLKLVQTLLTITFIMLMSITFSFGQTNVSTIKGSHSGNATSQPPPKPYLDFNGDGKTDYVVVRSASVTSPSTWFINYTGSGTGLSQAQQLGAGVSTVFYAFPNATDFAVPGDYDGDGKTDIAVWRSTSTANPNSAYFFILQSSNNTVRIEQFGSQGDDPSVVGDYDGDGKADLAVFRTGTAVTSGDPCGGGAVWYYRPSTAPATNFRYVCWGSADDLPAPGDYDGDGKMDFVTQSGINSGNNTLFALNKSGGGTEYAQWGSYNTDFVVPGDYDGDGKTDFAVVRGLLEPAGSPLTWYILTRTGQIQTYQFGDSGDLPAQGDYNGDGKTDIAVWRPSNGTFYIRPAGTTGSADFAFQWGQSGDVPVSSFNTH